MKKFAGGTVALLSLLPKIAAAQLLTQGELLVQTNDVASQNINEQTVFATAESWLIRVFAIVAVAVFIWTGRGILTASGDSDEFKKSLKSLLYAAIGLAVVPLAYVAVKLVISFNL